MTSLLQDKQATWRDFFFKARETAFIINYARLLLYTDSQTRWGKDRLNGSSSEARLKKGLTLPKAGYDQAFGRDCHTNTHILQ